MILTAREISSQLSAQAEGYARWLLPNGHKESGEWCVGSVDGDAGSSCKVRINGGKAGVFSDFAGTDKGDLLTLTSLTKHVTLGQAIRIAKEWLGIHEPAFVPERKTYVKPKPSSCKTAPDAVMEYLYLERNLDCFTQAKFKVSGFNDSTHGPVMVLPAFSPDGELLNNKFIAVKRNEKGKKIIWSETGCAPCLFGWQALAHDAREIVLTEGQIDCMTWHQAGFPALSVPDGAANDAWVDFNWDSLQQFERIYLNYDDDEEGKKAIPKIAARLGLARCFIVRLPGFKDANEALQGGFSNDRFAAAVAASKPLSPKQIKSPNELAQKVIDEFYPPDGIQPGFFPSIFHGKLGLRPGEVTIWTGVSGHGKTILLNQIILEAILAGHRAAIASMEMPVHKILRWMLRQSDPLIDNFSQPEIVEILNWLTGKLWIYDLLGNVQPKLVLELMEYSFARHGVGLFVVDSLMKCAIDSDDYNAQRMFLNDLCSFSMSTGVHINLVAHARKGANELDAPGKMDVRGSGDIINQPANVLSVWRNKEKEMKTRNGATANDAEPDAIVYCNKQRETGVEFAEKFLFSRLRFTPIGSGSINLSILDRLHPHPTEQELNMEVGP